MPCATRTTCPYCGVGCGVIAAPQIDGSLDIRGDPEHPANFGRLCSKGSALGETVALDGRLLYPQIGGERVEWAEAIGLVGNVFSETVRRHGPDSVAFYVSGQLLTEDYYVANKLMKGFIGSANIDTNSRLCMASSVAGHKRAFGSDTVPGCYEDLELADVIVLTGSNLAWCHPVLYQRIAAARQQRPEMKVVLIDPRRTMTADIADLHLAIRPDGDVALFNGLLSHLADGCLDADYIAQHTSGIDAALEAADCDLQSTAEQTGLSPAALHQFYTLFANTEKVVTLYSQGVNQSRCGTDKVNAIINCHLATGRIGRPGMGPFSVTGQPNAMGGREVGGLANTLAAHMNLENPDHRKRVRDFWKSPAIAARQGLKAVDLFEAVHDGRIKALWIMATNPVDSMPDADRVRKALKKCPFVVVSDVLETTDTVRHAHVRLPSLAWGEKDGTVTNSERRISRQRSFLPAPGEARPDWWQMAQVAKAMGFADGFNHQYPAEIFAEFARLSGTGNDGSRDFDISAHGQIDLQSYNAMRPHQWPVRPGDMPSASVSTSASPGASPSASPGATPAETRFFADGNFYTPDRRARFVPTPAHRDQSADRNALILNTGRIRDHWHTMTRTGRSQRLSSHMAEPFCEIHPLDAARFNIMPAGLVRLWTERGEIIVRALISRRQRQGSVFVPMHWTDQYTAKGRVDALFPPVTDPVSGQPALKNTTVRLAPFAARQYGFLVSRTRPEVVGLDYWALARRKNGWQLEFAIGPDVSGQPSLWEFFGLREDAAAVSYRDAASAAERYAWFDGPKLQVALFLGAEPVAVSRSWAAEQLVETHRDPQQRWLLASGRAPADRPDKGAIVCSCFSVGVNEIADAVRRGCHSADSIGAAISAGTNCGSCRAELNGLIDEYALIAAE